MFITIKNIDENTGEVTFDIELPEPADADAPAGTVRFSGVVRIEYTPPFTRH